MRICSRLEQVGVAAVIWVTVAALAVQTASHARGEQPVAEPRRGERSPDRTRPAPTAADAPPADVEPLLASMLPPRSDSPTDWHAPPPFLYFCGEPRRLAPCVPPAPCHPAYPPFPTDLVGVAGLPTCGPRYRGPCEPRLGTHAQGPLPRLHGVCDAAFDAFYR
jgi:hypothetical protein